MYSQIPRRIFQTWKSKTDIPDNMRYWSTTWHKFNETYHFDFWDDDDNRRFIAENYPWFLPKYDSYDVMIKRVDAVRYFYLYHYGGIYADMDFECLKSFDKILELEKTNDILLGRMGTEKDEDHEHNIPNAIMISKPRQDFWLYLIYILLNANDRCEAEYCTGPVMLKKAFIEYTNNYEQIKQHTWLREICNTLPSTLKPIETTSRIALLDTNVFYPINWRNWEHQTTYRHPVINSGELYDETKVNELFPDSFAVTYWLHSW